ncbi:hypothetical protein MHYP_G00273200 [Metynnis hypsauchen]
MPQFTFACFCGLHGLCRRKKKKKEEEAQRQDYETEGDPSGPFANATTVKDGYHLSFLGNTSNLALSKFHLTSPQLLCGTWKATWHEFE